MASTVPLFEYRDAEVAGLKTFFPEAIDKDNWVLFHATSSIAEPLIDSEGLRWMESSCSFDDVLKIVRIFKSMNWPGHDTGGYGVLVSFTLIGDFRGSCTKPVYFREASRMTLLYTTRDFAGGETVRAARRAIRDLERYLNDKTVSEEHYQKQRRDCIRDVSAGYLPTSVIRVKLDWLADQVRHLSSVRDRCEAFDSGHAHGVVYAVRFLPSDLPHLEYCSSMGIRCAMPIPPERFVGKARILGDDYDPIFAEGYDAFGEYCWRAKSKTSLVHALEKPGKRKKAASGTASENSSPAVQPIEPDPTAGIDECNSIGLEYGTPEIQEYIRRHANQSTP